MEQKTAGESKSVEKVTIGRTFSQLQEVDVVVGQIYAKNPELKNGTKFSYAYDQFHKKNYAPILKEFQDAIAYIRIDNALEEPTTKAIFTEEITPQNGRGFKYSKEGLKKCMKEEVECIEKFNVKEVEIIPYISTTIPDGLTKQQTEVLSGLII